VAQEAKEKGDRHFIIVDPEKGKLYEFYQGRKTETGWECACAALFDLKSNKLRPDGWTSIVYQSVLRVHITNPCRPESQS
jgi:hypothetical protein